MPTTSRTRTRRIDPDEIIDNDPPFVTDDEEEEEAPPARSRSRSRQQAQEEPRPRKRAAQRDEEPDEEPEGTETVIPIFRGRKAIKDSRNSQGGNMYFKWADDGEGQVVKFLADENGDLAWSYNSHWVTRGGRQSFPCIGKDCPLCEIGVRVDQKIVYTVLNLSHSDGPTVQVLVVTPTVDDALTALDTGKQGPLTRLSWEASRPKKPNPTNFSTYNYVFTPVKDRDLGDDYDIDIKEVNEALAKVKIPDPEKVLGQVDVRVLQEIADESVNGR